TKTLQVSVDGGAYTTLATGSSAVTSIAGTANQVIASASVGAVTLSLPQSIAVGSSVQFGALGLGTTAPASVLNSTGPLLTSQNVQISGGSSYLDQTDGTSSAVAPAGHSRLIYNNTSKVLQVSVDGGAYAAVAAATPTLTQVLGAGDQATSS